MSETSISTVAKVNLIGTQSNHIKLGIIGSTNVGKSGLFNAFVQQASRFSEIDACLFSTIDPNKGVFTPQDERVDFIAEVMKPKRIAPLRMTIVDTAGLVAGSFQQNCGVGAGILEHVRDADSLLHVVREFQNENVTHFEGTVDPVRDIHTINQELLQFDLDLIEAAATAAENIKQRGIGGAQVQFQWEVMCRAWEVIAGQPRPLRSKVFKKSTVFQKMNLPARCDGAALRFASWDYSERQLLADMRLLTTKRMLYLVNTSTRDYLRSGAKDSYQSICAAVELLGCDSVADVMRISSAFEMHLHHVMHVEKQWPLYHAANPHHQSAIPLVVAEVLRGLQLIRIYTADEEEVKCFLIRSGKTIVEASALVDVIIARNFIRGDVIAFDEFKKFNGDRIKMMIEGKVKPETKRYLINDGDIIEYFYHSKAAS